MKITLAFQCDLEDIPQTISEFMNAIKEADIAIVTSEIYNAQRHCASNNMTAALVGIDLARLKLSKIDQKLMDCAAIIAGYIKTDTDLKMGIDPTQNFEEGDTKDDQVNSSSESQPIE